MRGPNIHELLRYYQEALARKGELPTDLAGRLADYERFVRSRARTAGAYSTKSLSSSGGATWSLCWETMNKCCSRFSKGKIFAAGSIARTGSRK